MTDRLRVVPVTRDAALAFISAHHRHAKRPQGYRFALGADLGGELVGVAIVGRPVARFMDDGETCEALRVCTDGTKNACSFLYGAAFRASRALGYQRLITYTLEREPGTSLRAAGFRLSAETRQRSWDRPKRPRTDQHELLPRLRWERVS